MDFCLLLENIVKNISKNFSSKCSKKLFDHAKQPATDAIKTASKNLKNSRSSWWFNWKKIADKIIRVSKTSPQNNLESNEEEILRERERYISPEFRFKINIIIYNVTMEYQKITNLLDDTTNQPSKFRTRNWV